MNTNLQPFKPGPDPRRNLAGRPLGLMPFVRKQTKDGKEIIAVLMQVLRGEPFGRQKPTIDHRIQAARELLQRGWGRVPESEDGEARTFTLVVKKGDDY